MSNGQSASHSQDGPWERIREILILFHSHPPICAVLNYYYSAIGQRLAGFLPISPWPAEAHSEYNLGWPDEPATEIKFCPRDTFPPGRDRCMAKENINYLPIKEIRGICCSRQGSRINYSLGEKHKEMDSSACLGSHRIIGQGDDVKADILLANILLAEVSPTLTRHKGNPWVIRCKLWLTIRRWTYSNAIPSLCGILEKLYSLSNER